MKLHNLLKLVKLFSIQYCMKIYFFNYLVKINYNLIVTIYIIIITQIIQFPAPFRHYHI